MNKKPSERVFNITARGLWVKIHYWAKKAGVPHIHTHSFRHKFATDLLQKSANIRAILELMGQKILSITERYLAVTDGSRAWAAGMLDGSSCGNLYSLNYD